MGFLTIGFLADDGFEGLRVPPSFSGTSKVKGYLVWSFCFSAMGLGWDFEFFVEVYGEEYEFFDEA